MDDKTALAIMELIPGEPCPYFSEEFEGDFLLCPGAVMYEEELYCTLEGVGIPLLIAELDSCSQGDS